MPLPLMKENLAYRQYYYLLIDSAHGTGSFHIEKKTKLLRLQVYSTH